MNDMEQINFSIISFAGEAKSSAMEAINLAKNKNYDGATLKIKEAKENVLKAQEFHFKLVGRETREEAVPLSLLLIHAEDIMINAQTTIELAEQFYDLYLLLHQKGN